MTAFSPRQTTNTFSETRISRSAGAGYDLLVRPGQAPARQPGPLGAIGRGLAAIAAGIREHVRREQVKSELSRLTDRELADIGLTRTEIGRIFTPEFAAEHRA